LAAPVKRLTPAWRLWLPRDYEDATLPANLQISVPEGDTLDDAIKRKYRQVKMRADVEVPPELTSERAMPSRGMQVHSEYLMYAHFELLHRPIGHAEKIRFFLDLDSGIRGACLSAFVEEIRSQHCDALYVKTNKSLIQEQKAKAVADARKRFDAEVAHDPDLLAGGWPDVKTFRETADELYAIVQDRVRLRLLKEAMRQARQIGPWLDRWIKHPLPTMSEAEKQFCCLTPIDHYDEDRLARVLSRASLHGIDRFFMQLRRRVSLAERPIATARSPARHSGLFSNETRTVTPSSLR
jgi:hypothetical protein